MSNWIDASTPPPIDKLLLPEFSLSEDVLVYFTLEAKSGEFHRKTAVGFYSYAKQKWLFAARWKGKINVLRWMYIPDPEAEAIGEMSSQHARYLADRLFGPVQVHFKKNAIMGAFTGPLDLYVEQVQISFQDGNNQTEVKLTFKKMLPDGSKSNRWHCLGAQYDIDRDIESIAPIIFTDKDNEDGKTNDAGAGA